MEKQHTALYFFVIVILACSIGQWVWIVFREGTQASSWNSEAVATPTAYMKALKRSVSAAYAKGLQGRRLATGTLALILIYYLSACVKNAAGHQVAVYISFVLCLANAGIILAIAWWNVGQPHDVSVLAMLTFSFRSGIFGILIAGYLNAGTLVSFVVADQYCNPMVIDVTSTSCNIKAAVEWVLTPGLHEETWKSIWLFWSLRATEDDLPKTCCFCAPAVHGDQTGSRWFLLSPTPYHVLLFALSAGAGFGAMENLSYVFGAQSAFGHPTLDPSVRFGTLISSATVRMIASSMHMVWTTIIGMGLARRMFLPDRMRPTMFGVLLPSMVLHGMYDYAVTGAINANQHPFTRWMSYEYCVLFVLCSLGSIWLACYRTGANFSHCPCAGSQGSTCGCCCCQDGFWEEMYDIPKAREGPLGLATLSSGKTPLLGGAVAVQEPLLPA